MSGVIRALGRIVTLSTLHPVVFIAFMASSKEQGLAGLDISFFTFTFKAPAADIKNKSHIFCSIYSFW